MEEESTVANKGGYARNAVLICIAVLVILLLGGIVGYARYFRDTSQPVDAILPDNVSISTFEECVAGGNPIMESYPEQCRADGQTFVNPNQQVPEMPEAGVLEIVEWGLKVDIGQNESLQYRILRDAGHGDERLHLANKASIDFMMTHCGGDGFGLVTISSVHEESPDTVGLEYLMEDDGHYYYVASASDNCSDKPEEEAAIRRGLIEAAKTLSK